MCAVASVDDVIDAADENGACGGGTLRDTRRHILSGGTVRQRGAQAADAADADGADGVDGGRGGEEEEDREDA